MSTITVNETQLEEVVSKVVQQHLKLTFQDMDEVRKSPAGAIVRLETKMDSLVTSAEFREEIGALRAEYKDGYSSLSSEYKDGYSSLSTRQAKVESKLNLLVALFMATFGVMASLLIKLIFFP
jgi:hypothetical protein